MHGQADSHAVGVAFHRAAKILQELSWSVATAAFVKTEDVVRRGRELAEEPEPRQPHAFRGVASSRRTGVLSALN